MRTNFLSLIFLTATAPAWAGPAGAIFCKAPDQSRTLSAYDIAVGTPNAHIITFSAQASGRTVFQMENYKIRSEVLELTEAVATIRYVKPNGKNAQALVAEIPGNRMATVEKVKFLNYGIDESNQRKGSVIIYLDEGPTKELIYKDCFYQGGLVSGDWKDLWAIN